MTGLRLALISPNAAIVTILFFLTFVKGKKSGTVTAFKWFSWRNFADRIKTITNTNEPFSVLLVHLSLSILITKCKIITGEFQKAYIYFVPFDSIHFRTVCLWKLLMLTTGVVFHDAIYQFLRIFYHSRFKPDNLQMTLAQWAMPIVDLIFLAGPLLQIKRSDIFL